MAQQFYAEQLLTPDARTARQFLADRGFDQVMRGLLRLSFAVTRVIQNGRLDIYLTVTFVVVAFFETSSDSLHHLRHGGEDEQN